MRVILYKNILYKFYIQLNFIFNIFAIYFLALNKNLKLKKKSDIYL